MPRLGGPAQFVGVATDGVTRNDIVRGVRVKVP